jgi:uncharacterized membrane protein
MSNSKKIAQAAVAGAIASLTLLGSATPAVAATEDVKCYGIAAADKNDCGTVVSACSGSIPQAGACYAWIFLPKGICEKINGASVGKPAADCKDPSGKPAK